MKLKNTLIYTLPLAVLLSSCGADKEEKKTVTDDVIPVKVMQLAADDAEVSTQLAGQFTTDDEVMLAFKTGGVINKLYVKEGDEIHKGQLLATLDLTEINAQVAQAKLGYDKAERDYKRVQNLYTDSVATLEQLQNVKTALDVAKQYLTAAQFNLNYSEIRATANGYVLRKLASEGQLVGGGMPVFQTNGAKANNWVLKAGVSDRQWASIKINDTALVYTETAPQQAIRAMVTRKSEGADPMTGSFTVELKLMNTNGVAIASGMYGKATVSHRQGAVLGNSRTIPYDALLDGNGSTGYVFITNDDHTAHKVQVEVGEVLKDKVVITNGLQDVKSVIVTGSAYLNENSKIKVIQ